MHTNAGDTVNMGKQSQTDLKLLSNYWCKSVAPDYEDRFFWAYEKVDVDSVEAIGETARAMLQALALSAPDEYTAGLLAAGPLENYINLIVKNRAADEAAYIVDNRLLNHYLPLVWGKVDELMPLARKGQVKSTTPVIVTALKMLDLREVMGFWCKVCVTSRVHDYDGYYSNVLNKLHNKNTRENAMQDLLLSTPDKGLEEYLTENIFNIN
jgi:hypothetical protein